MLELVGEGIRSRKCSVDDVEDGGTYGRTEAKRR